MQHISWPLTGQESIKNPNPPPPPGGLIIYNINKYYFIYLFFFLCVNNDYDERTKGKPLSSKIHFSLLLLKMVIVIIHPLTAVGPDRFSKR